MIAGFVGLVSLIVENWNNGSPKLHAVALAFGLPAGLCVAMILGDCCKCEGCEGAALPGMGILLPSFLILSVLFGDWAMGAMTNNLAGVPTNDQALYYLYWISKRFTMFSW